jgi:uncharacterized protein
MSHAVSRRRFIAATGALAGAAAVGAPGAALADRGSRRKQGRQQSGYGALNPVADGTTGEELLALPEGFSYRSFGREGEPMSNGKPTPGAHDGMATFPHPSRRDWVLIVRNHEQNDGDPFVSPAYAPDAAGGVVNLTYDLRAQKLVSAHPVLSGTARNCGGGSTPWGSWLSCEESNVVSANGTQHGYVFEVPASATSPIKPEPLKGLGAMVHEAAPVDPRTGVVYLTEDTGNSGLYRFIPDRPGRLADGGVLQMLAISGRPKADLRTGQRVGKRLPVAWVTIDDPDPASFADDEEAVFKQGYAKGGARFVGGEGAWYGNGSIVFACSPGGDAERGQVWSYTPRGRSGGSLELRFESPGMDVLDNPDNITVSPGGALLVCEDGSVDNYLRGITDEGEIFNFAFNMMSDYSWSEFAGATWSPDGSTLFVNLQGPGISFAVTGPWERGPFGGRRGKR